MRRKILCAVVLSASIGSARANLQEKLIAKTEEINSIKQNIQMNKPACKGTRCRTRCQRCRNCGVCIKKSA